MLLILLEGKSAYTTCGSIPCWWPCQVECFQVAQLLPVGQNIAFDVPAAVFVESG